MPPAVAVLKDGLLQQCASPRDLFAALIASGHTIEVRNEGLVFFGYLQKYRPGLLNFRNQGDKWQAVHGWLLRAHKVKNRQAPSRPG